MIRSIFILLLCSIVVSLAVAQERQPLFPRGYVLEKKDERHPIASGVAVLRDITRDNLEPEKLAEPKAQLALSPSQEAEDEQANFENPLTARPIQGLGVVLDLQQPEVIQDSIDEFLRTVVGLDVPITEVYLVGDRDAFFRERKNVRRISRILFGAPLLGGELHYVRELPKWLPITYSPAWLLSLDEGDVLLEGFLSLERYVNEKKEFVSRGALREGGIEQETTLLRQ